MAATKANGFDTRAQREFDRLLILNWNKMSNFALAELLKCDLSTITRRAKRLREIGVDLPEKGRANRLEPEVPKPTEEKEVGASLLGRRWPDGWRVLPPSKDRLRAGK